MSLRIKTLLIIGAVLIGLVGILYVLSQTILLANYAQLEAQNARQNVERASNGLTDDLDALAANNSDYAWWDDTYTFAVDHNAAYLETYVTPIFVNLEFNLLVITDSNNQIIASKAVDLNTQQDIAVPAGLDDYLKADSPLLNHPDIKGSVSGVIMLPDGPMLIASQAILTSQLDGPSHGSVIFGQLLDDAQIQKLSDSLKLPISVYNLTSGNLPADVVAAQQHLSQDAPIYTSPINNDTIAGYSLVNDLSGKPALLLQVTLPRDIYSQGQSSISIFLLVLIGAGVIFGILTMLLLEQTVTSRLRGLGRDMRGISQSGDLSKRLDVSGGDELSVLGQDINQMLSALENSQRSLHGNDERLRTVVKASPILLWSTDNKGIVTLLEGKSLDLLGLVPADSIGQPISEVYRNIPHLVQEIRRALKGEEFSSQLPVSSYVFDTHYVPLKNEDGTIEGMIGVATDITEQTKTEAALQTASRDLTQKNQQLVYTRNLFRSAVQHLTTTTEKGVPQTEILEYLKFLEKQINEQN